MTPKRPDTNTLLREAACHLRDTANNLRQQAATCERMADACDRRTITTPHDIVTADQLRPGDTVLFPFGDPRRVSAIGHPDWAQVLIEWDHAGDIEPPAAYPSSVCFTVACPRPPADDNVLEGAF